MSSHHCTEITVIIPTKDRLPYLRRNLATFLSEPEVREVLVVVDGSTDGTVEFLEQFCAANDRVRYLDNNGNRGLPFTKNRALEEVATEYAFIGEDDLEVTEGFFATLGAHLIEANADVVCGRNIFRYEHETAEEAVARTSLLQGPYVDMKTIELESGMSLESDMEQPIIAAPMLARTAIFREVRFDERFKVNFFREETDFQLAARAKGYRLLVCPHAVCFNLVIANDQGGVHSSNVFGRMKWTVKNNWLFLSKHEAFIREHFEIGNKYAYIVKFAGGKVAGEILWRPAPRKALAILRKAFRRDRPADVSSR